MNTTNVPLWGPSLPPSVSQATTDLPLLPIGRFGGFYANRIVQYTLFWREGVSGFFHTAYCLKSSWKNHKGMILKFSSVYPGFILFIPLYGWLSWNLLTHSTGSGHCGCFQSLSTSDTNCPTVHVWICFWARFSVPLIYLFIFAYPMPNSLDHCCL